MTNLSALGSAQPGMRVFVYWNLHRQVFSLKALEGPNKGRVVAHSETVQLRNVIGKVSEAGRQRVIREQRKNVHAGMSGTLVSLDPTEFDGHAVSYNPYKAGHFYFKTDGEPFAGADEAYLAGRQVSVRGNVLAGL